MFYTGNVERSIGFMLCCICELREPPFGEILMSMPEVNREVLSHLSKTFADEELAIINIIIKKNGEVRASKPKVKDIISGKAAYVWRMVVFSVSTKPQHQCMPVCADFDLPAYDENGKWTSSAAREMSKKLKPIEDAIVNSIPKAQWHGVRRWKNALYGA